MCRDHSWKINWEPHKGFASLDVKFQWVSFFVTNFLLWWYHYPPSASGNATVCCGKLPFGGLSCAHGKSMQILDSLYFFLRWLIWVTTSTCQFTKDSSTTLAVKKGLPIDEVKLQLLKLTMIAQFLSETGPSLGTHQRIGTGYLQFQYLWGSTSRVTGGLARHIFRDWWYHQFCWSASKTHA